MGRPLGGAFGRRSAEYPPPSGRQPSDRTPQPSASSGRLPHLQLETPRRPGYDMLLWLAVLVVAVCTALAVFRFFPTD
jgi:hypothetical protein